MLFRSKGRKWEDALDDQIHNPGRLNPRVGQARMIYETSDFRSGGGKGWAWEGLLNTAAIAILVCGIVGVFAGESALVSPCENEAQFPYSVSCSTTGDQSDLRQYHIVQFVLLRRH